jgi:hypothetical protein
VPGHLNPMTTLARQLQSRGHDVVYIGLTLAGPAVCAAHLPFVLRIYRLCRVRKRSWPPQFYHTGPFHDGAPAVSTRIFPGSD